MIDMGSILGKVSSFITWLIFMITKVFYVFELQKSLEYKPFYFGCDVLSKNIKVPSCQWPLNADDSLITAYTISLLNRSFLGHIAHLNINAYILDQSNFTKFNRKVFQRFSKVCLFEKKKDFWYFLHILSWEPLYS